MAMTRPLWPSFVDPGAACLGHVVCLSLIPLVGHEADSLGNVDCVPLVPGDIRRDAQEKYPESCCHG